MSPLHKWPDKYQNGLATLATTLLLLFIITIASLWAARIGVTEQQISGNLHRERQAFAAAQAGLATALNKLQWQHLNGPRPAGGTGMLDGGAAYAYTYRFSATPMGNTLIEMTARGESGDGPGERILRQTARFAPSVIKRPDAPLTGRASVDVSGAVISNVSGGPIIRAGGAIAYIPAPTAQGCNPAASCVSDPLLGGMEEAGYFSSWFGIDKEAFTRLSTQYVCGQCKGIANQQIAVMIIISNGEDTPLSLENTTLGSPQDPVILVIDSDISRLSGITLHGLLYVTGDIDAPAHAVTIVGALVAGGDAGLRGNLELAYDGAVLDNLDKLGHFTVIPGTWHDF